MKYALLVLLMIFSGCEEEVEVVYAKITLKKGLVVPPGSALHFPEDSWKPGCKVTTFANDVILDCSADVHKSTSDYINEGDFSVCNRGRILHYPVGKNSLTKKSRILVRVIPLEGGDRWECRTMDDFKPCWLKRSDLNWLDECEDQRETVADPE